jgi:hypothetical protein
MKTIELGGIKYLWRDILRLRREQKKAQRKAQLTLFELKNDDRPQSQRCADGRYLEPLLFQD